MPCAEAFALTAVNSDFGSRMLTRSVFGSNSKWTVVNFEKSRSDRSCSRNASASASVFSLGIRLFIGLDLLLMHVTSGDGANCQSSMLYTKGEGDEDRSPFMIPPEANEPVLMGRVRGIGRDLRRTPQYRFDLRDRHAVLLALLTVCLIPIEFRYFHTCSGAWRLY